MPVHDDKVYHARCVKDDYRDDGKSMKVVKGEESLGDGTSMVPSEPGKVSAPEEGSEVTFLGSKWKVVAREGDVLQIEKDGKTREVNVAQVE